MVRTNEQIKRIFLVIFTAAVFVTAGQSADTWHLQQGQQWQSVGESAQSGYALAVSELKELINEGRVSAAGKKLNELKQNYPELAGEDLDAFFKAEKLYANNQYDKATAAYDDFLKEYPQSSLYEAALERKYQLSIAYLQGRKKKLLGFPLIPAYDKGREMMNEIADRTGDAPIAKRSLTALARNQKKLEKYLDEYETWAEISTRWPTGELAREAQFGMAYALHSAYKGPRYDAAPLDSARTYYNNIISRYPPEAARAEIPAKVSLVDEQAAYKQFKIGEYYRRTDFPDSALISYREVVEKWPGSKAAEMAEEKIAILTGEKAAPKQDKTPGRKLFDFGTYILDDWVSKFDLSGVLKD